MSYNPLFAALQASYGAPPEEDPTTVRGLQRYCRQWLRGEISAEDLHNPCWEMAGRLRGAAQATFADLEKNPELCEESREPVIVTGEGYEAIASILEELPVLAAENQREDFEEALEEYEAERVAVLEATEEINAQMSGQERRCFRCASTGERVRCEYCGLIMLYPDPKQLRDYSYRSAALSPLHQTVYKAYLAVLEGRESLEILLGTLPALSKHLKDITRFCDSQASSGELDWAVSSLRQNVQTAMGGVARIEGVASTYRASDLNRGWEDIFESSVAIRDDVVYLGRAQGQAQGAHPGAMDGFGSEWG